MFASTWPATPLNTAKRREENKIIFNAKYLVAKREEKGGLL
jgi:hypothetical protein